MIQKLKAENEKLKQLIATSGPDSRGPSEMMDKGKWEEEMKAVVKENERQMKGQLRDTIYIFKLHLCIV